MKKAKQYANTFFSAEVIAEATESLRELVCVANETCDDNESGQTNSAVSRDREYFVLEIHRGHVQWTYDSEEQFFADYRSSIPDNALYSMTSSHLSLSVMYWKKRRKSSVEIGSNTVREIDQLFKIFDSYEESCRIESTEENINGTDNEQPIVFIGHGHDTQWRELKDHLQDKHGYEVEAYEVGARAGHSVRDTLQSMLKKSSFALLVMTKEDSTADGTMRSRQNVVHEAGLFQGHLGFNRAIMIVEDGLEDFSNIRSIEQIRFQNGHIRETFGDIVATLKREFGS